MSNLFVRGRSSNGPGDFVCGRTQVTHRKSMITRLRLENFRRHENTELAFDDGEQLIAVQGPNGAGKSSILEAITYGLYGEGRNGHRNLDRLVRRGAELEGMQVEIEFTLGDDRWRVVRRRDARVSSAMLYGNDNPLVEGAKQVTAHIASLLGMDAAGFRLAVISQQRELDGLIKLGGPARARMLARLLRLDAVTRARDDARVRYREIHAGLEAVPTAGDLAGLEAEAAQAEADLTAAKAAEAACRAEIARLEATLSDNDGLTAAWQQARDAHADAVSTLRAAETDRDRIKAALEAIVVTEPPTVDQAVLERLGLDTLDANTLTELGATIEGSLARAEAAKATLDTARALDSDIERAQARAAELDRTIAAIDATLTDDDLDARVTQARETTAAAAEVRDNLRVKYGELQGALHAARERLANAESLEGTCDRCGQAIDDTHRDSQLETARAEVERLEAELDSTRTQGLEAAQKLTAAEEGVERAERARADVGERTRRRSVAVSEREELTRQLQAWKARREHLNVEAGDDLDTLYARKGDFAVALGMLRDVEAAERNRAAATAARAARESELEEVHARIKEAQTQVEQTQVDPKLAADVEALRAAEAALRNELALSATLAGATGEAEARLVAVKERINAARRLASRRQELTARAMVASNGAQLLDTVSSRLTDGVKPSLEGAVCDKLAQLSDGRFSAVQVADDYTLRIQEDGQWLPLGEFSGGEQDLIALALRLAIAEVVTERSGSGGVGFLILDEVFGSQDESRRETILTALRNLRDIYGQVWCISHVGGIDEIADRVIDVTHNTETGTSEAS